VNVNFGIVDDIATSPAKVALAPVKLKGVVSKELTVDVLKFID
jgi:hypothetical protein